ncbi:LacI family transcriptional regulator/LacI family purine nucleotide synthesis repressor [Bacillus sp. 3255]|nr:LacI family transcriptional regulator/LacI family purine nucleotide synthesis repressor [Bacillus sp. 3255]
MNAKTSMQDIADRLGISKNAVSLALNHKPGVSEELRMRVFEAAQALHYPAEAKPKKKMSHLLVLVPESIQNDKSCYYQVFWSIEQRAKDLGYTTIISGVTKEMEQRLALPDLYYEIAFGGMLIVGAFHPDYIRKLSAAGLPLVTVDHSYDGLQLDAVVTANAEEAYKMTSHLIRLGHRRLGFIGASPMTKSIRDRWYGFNNALADAGLAADEAHCHPGSASRAYEMTDAAREELASYVNALKPDDLPTAWFCANDRLAIALIQLLSAKGIRVPEDVSVAGFDDIESAQLIMPRLTTIRVQREQLGREAVDVLIRKLEHGGSPAKLAVFGELIERDSCRRI